MLLRALLRTVASFFVAGFTIAGNCNTLTMAPGKVTHGSLGSLLCRWFCTGLSFLRWERSSYAFVMGVRLVAWKSSLGKWRGSRRFAQGVPWGHFHCVPGCVLLAKLHMLRHEGEDRIAPTMMWSNVTNTCAGTGFKVDVHMPEVCDWRVFSKVQISFDCSSG